MNILIPVDGSDSALWTIRQAGKFLNRQESAIYLFMVLVPVPAELPWALCNPEDEPAVRGLLEEARQQAQQAGLRVISTEYRIFHEPASAICEYATQKDLDLIVIGSHGYHGLSRFLMGSVSERVFRQARQPVIIVRNDKEHTVEISHFDRTGLVQAPSGGRHAHS